MNNLPALDFPTSGALLARTLPDRPGGACACWSVGDKLSVGGSRVSRAFDQRKEKREKRKKKKEKENTDEPQ
jgi:hypothetical protein